MDQAGAHRLARAGGGHVLAGEAHLPGARQQAGHGAQQGGLAGAVGAEQRDDLAGADRELDVAQHDDLAVAGRQAAHLQQGFTRAVQANPFFRGGAMHISRSNRA